MAVEKGRQGHTFPPTIFLFLLTLNTRAYAYWLKKGAQNSKIGAMKANQSFRCGFCFEGSSL